MPSSSFGNKKERQSTTEVSNDAVVGEAECTTGAVVGIGRCFSSQLVFIGWRS